MAANDSLLPNLDAVKFEARLEDGTVVGQSEGVEFTVKEGKCLSNNDQLFKRSSLCIHNVSDSS